MEFVVISEYVGMRQFICQHGIHIPNLSSKLTFFLEKGTIEPYAKTKPNIPPQINARALWVRSAQTIVAPQPLERRFH
jgi:hypothetical protein